MKRFLSVAILLLGVNAPAHAAPSDREDPAYFADYIQLTSLLRSRNIDPVFVNWRVINPMCLPLRVDGDESAFNRCKFDNAILERDFKLDEDTCNRRARVDVPNSLLSERLVRTYTAVKPPATQPEVVREFAPGLTRRELDEARDASYGDCMDERGWINVYDWPEGRRE